MLIEFDKIADYLGELCAAARHDISTANPADVGMGGVQIVAWRKAYAEGCKDACEGVLSRLPKELHQEANAMVLASFEREKSRLEAERVPA